MKIFFRIPALVVALLISLTVNSQYSYKFKIEGLTDTVVYLANYFGKSMYYNDTASVGKNGEFEFKGEGKKPYGVYAVVLPDRKSYFELIVSEPKIVMETKRSDMVNSMKIKVSEENKAFYEYVHKVNELKVETDKLKDELAKAEGEKQKEEIRKKLDEADKRFIKYKADYLKKYEGLFAAKLLYASKDPTVPEFKKDNGELDDEKRFNYYKAHYFDNIDMRDERLLYSPVLGKKIEYYLEKLTPQVPDSICAAVKYLVSLSGDTGKIFKYIVQFTTNKYEKSQIMGMDAVFVCIAENYYTKGKTWWLDSAKLAEIEDIYRVRRHLILGKRAEPIILQDTSGVWRNLYDIKADYTVLIFWDPNCGHCKREVPALLKEYHKMKENGISIEVFAVGTEFENKDWIAFVKKHKLDWINVSDNPEVNRNAHKYLKKGLTTLNSLNFRDYWDIFSTPQIYVLDKEKVIIAKRLSAEQIEEFIHKYEERNKGH